MDHARTVVAFCLVTLTSLSLRAQQDPAPATEACIQRVLAGGDLVELRWRRAADGTLEVDWGSDHGQESTFRSLLGDDLGEALQVAGLFGWLALVCHGDTDLLGMTNAEWRLRRAGVGTQDAELRQFVASPLPGPTDAGARAALLERMLAVDLLRLRNCTNALGELEALAAAEAPAALRIRARAAAASLRGATAAPPRRRLDADAVPLPAAFDGAIVIDHARLPDLRWMPLVARRLGQFVTLQAMIAAGGDVGDAAIASAQQVADVPCELPFGVTLRCGNARIDHSLVVVSATAGGAMPVAITWSAAGEFEAERWRSAVAPAFEEPWLEQATLDVRADSLRATTDGSRGRPRPAVARELLADTGAAIRIVVPANSKLWLAAASVDLPAALGAELRITFGDPGVVVLTVTARDEDGAAEWMQRLRALNEQRVAAAREQFGAILATCPPAKAWAADEAAATFTRDGAVAVTTIAIHGFTVASVLELVEALGRSMLPQ